MSDSMNQKPIISYKCCLAMYSFSPTKLETSYINLKWNITRHNLTLRSDHRIDHDANMNSICLYQSLPPTVCMKLFNPNMSTGEWPYLDIIHDRRFWVIHLVTIPSLFISGSIFILTGFVYKLFSFGSISSKSTFNDSSPIVLVNDRFSVLNELEDV